MKSSSQRRGISDQQSRSGSRRYGLFDVPEDHKSLEAVSTGVARRGYLRVTSYKLQSEQHEGLSNYRSQTAKRNGGKLQNRPPFPISLSTLPAADFFSGPDTTRAQTFRRANPEFDGFRFWKHGCHFQ